jgi:hypothetical protein
MKVDARELGKALRKGGAELLADSLGLPVVWRTILPHEVCNGVIVRVKTEEEMLATYGSDPGNYGRPCMPYTLNGEMMRAYGRLCVIHGTMSGSTSIHLRPLDWAGMNGSWTWHYEAVLIED